ncbi:MAG: FAD-dependent monooxygenase, partial [Acidobacteriota bacterium]
MLPGEWSFRTASSDEDLDGRSGTATIEENPDPGVHGFMKAFGSKWGWQGTERAFIPQYGMGREPAAAGGSRLHSAGRSAELRRWAAQGVFRIFAMAQEASSAWTGKEGSMTGHPLVLIVGAGPTGLGLALWLTRLGITVRIIDKTAMPGTTSRALAVQARTLEFYHQVGLADAVIAGGVKIANLNFWVKGARAARVPLQRIGEGLSPYPFALIFPQDAHERLLIERLGALGVKVERQTELLGFEQHGGGMRATLRRLDGSEDVCEAAYLAGCDGASSSVREELALGFPGGTYTGLFYV